MSPVKVLKDDRPNLKPLAGQCRLTFKTSSSESDSSGAACAMEVSLERPPECVASSSKFMPDLNGNSFENLMKMDCDSSLDPAAILPKGQLQIDTSGQLHKAKGIT